MKLFIPAERPARARAITPCLVYRRSAIVRRRRRVPLNDRADRRRSISRQLSTTPACPRRKITENGENRPFVNNRERASFRYFVIISTTLVPTEPGRREPSVRLFRFHFIGGGFRTTETSSLHPVTYTCTKRPGWVLFLR